MVVLCCIVDNWNLFPLNILVKCSQAFSVSLKISKKWNLFHHYRICASCFGHSGHVSISTVFSVSADEALLTDDGLFISERNVQKHPFTYGNIL